MPHRPILLRAAARAILLCLTATAVMLPSVARADREMRAAWVASVFNINFPSKAGLSAEQQRQEIVRLCETARNLNLNALMVQVRPEGDALYRSNLEPWSRVLTGVQGRDPGYDPLAVFLDEGRKRGLAIHAWINPYRAAVNASQARASTHVSNRLPGDMRKVRNLLWCDPGSPRIQKHTLAVVRDIVSRYPIAGLHLDDYFYPYPEDAARSVNFPDSASYKDYRGRGGNLSLADWRRDNVNSLVKNIGSVVHGTRSGCQFGVSPFGIYTQGQPADVEVKLDQYQQLFADPVRWMNEGWVDYLAPQLYWRNGSPQSFGRLLWWWRHPKVNRQRVPIYPGIALDRLTGSHNWPADEIKLQMRLQKSISPASGFILYNIRALQNNTKGVNSVIAR